MDYKTLEQNLRTCVNLKEFYDYIRIFDNSIAVERLIDLQGHYLVHSIQGDFAILERLSDDGKPGEGLVHPLGTDFAYMLFDKQKR